MAFLSIGEMDDRNRHATKVEDFKYMGLTVQINGEWRSEEESTGRMEWVEKNVRSDLRPADIYRVKGKVYKVEVRPAML